MTDLHSIAEKNARVAARGEYFRWLAKRFGDLDLLLTMQGEDRVSLRKIYVPLRIDTEDRADESMKDPEQGGAPPRSPAAMPARSSPSGPSSPSPGGPGAASPPWSRLSSGSLRASARANYAATWRASGASSRFRKSCATTRRSCPGSAPLTICSRIGGSRLSARPRTKGSDWTSRG